MDSTNYTDDYDTKGLVPIRDIVPPSILSEAEYYADEFKYLTLKGKIKPDSTGNLNLSEEEKEKDRRAIEIIQELKEKGTPAIAYGFMLYNEASIVKIYWTQRVGKLRQDKRDFFQVDKYLEWLENIATTLCGNHEAFHDPLYYYKFKSSNRAGTYVGYYDIMNSFRVHWNMYYLKALAAWLYEQDKKEFDNGISIEGTLEADNGSNAALEYEMTKSSKVISNPEEEDTYREVENFLKSFLEEPLNEPVPMNKTVPGYGLTYLDFLKELVKGEVTSGQALNRKLGIGDSIRSNIQHVINRQMDKFGIILDDLIDYLKNYRIIALDILEGRKGATFSNLDY